MSTNSLIKKRTARDAQKLMSDVNHLLDGNRAQFRLVDSIPLRSAQFDKKVLRNRKKSKAAKAARKRNR